MSKLIEAQYEELDRLVNATIAELVFLRQHAEQDDQDDAGNCQITAMQNIERIGDILEDGWEES
jgi:hypothetical protein